MICSLLNTLLPSIITQIEGLKFGTGHEAEPSLFVYRDPSDPILQYRNCVSCVMSQKSGKL